MTHPDAQAWLHSSYLQAAAERPGVADTLRRLLGDNVAYWKDLLLRHGEVQDTEPNPPALRRLGAIRCPVLILVGDRDDPDILRLADTLLAHLPTARKVILRGVGHVPSLEAPQAFRDAILPFLTGP